ncbi:MAG: SUMF1/EgtB/PvdO family nonheme iron enzyme [Cytophagales bacterium]|nr:SUMF1/EgtB/PvdO family nonheme iron enzyme [Cytophagales bacterium]
MKKFSGLIYTLLLLSLGACGILGGGSSKKNPRGQLVGTLDREGFEMSAQYGMVHIPTGRFYMGQADENIQSDQSNSNRQVTISAFYMDDTEITNDEYRQFIQFIEENPDYELSEGMTLDKDVPGSVYPDTTVWTSDFTHHYGDPLLAYYWDHPAFDEYPVVGVSWEAASEFARWRTKLLNDYRKEEGQLPFPSFRLPTEAEWEYAARGGRDNVKYPWGNPYTRNSRGCVLANFKPGRGNYVDDGYAYTSPVGVFFPNDFGLYDMSGNVAEWCRDSYTDSYNPIVWDLNPIYIGEDTNRNNIIDEDEIPDKKVIRGGSWKDIAFFIEVATRTFEYKDSTRAFIGFRTALPHLGRNLEGL